MALLLCGFVTACDDSASTGDETDTGMNGQLTSTDTLSTSSGSTTAGGIGGESESGTTDGGEDDVLERRFACAETDFDSTPWMGPLFDPESGAQIAELTPPYVVATTIGFTYPGADLTKFNELNDGIIENLFTRDGFLGVRLAGSELCGSATTLTLWRDEAALMEMVFTPPHSEAMVHTYDIAEAWQTTHWTETQAVGAPSWIVSRAQLAKARAR